MKCLLQVAILNLCTVAYTRDLSSSSPEPVHKRRKGAQAGTRIHQRRKALSLSCLPKPTPTQPTQPEATRRTSTSTMEAEAFPIRFTKGIRSYWHRSKYHRVGGGGAAGRGGTRHNLVRLGDGGSGRPWGVRLGGMLRPVRVKAPAAAVAAAKAPARVLGRIRDAYVDAMLGAAKKQQQSAAGCGGTRALPSGPAPEALWQKRVPVRRSRSQAQVRQRPDELGQRLVLEMYKSVRASRDLADMLQASATVR
ncbi:uncharacterized protein LOC100828392 [Brachypodium distachyon]|uniref:Uncharacterized protein n=1 Tax=Brachypodium distachyon TaxID=15368 RepID=A0A2K2DDY6_BRADI|nr:uncharacterized protein LOC100828392 [Brachypodium distachyon]PNT72488.1 hypothetical protein BRADI_2g45080v3 [Brachypodium distachyon]|eukprot:XP_003569446.2 uncharacterized protein LOC100828392 [Brachypodium distachyon]